MDIEFREYRPEDDAEAVRDLLNVVFARAKMTPAGWAQWTAESFTAPVAVVNGRIRGAIPLCGRTYRVAPGAEVVAWVEHRVGVAGAWRDGGLGSGMQTAAKAFLRGRGDVLLVHRGAERSPGYHFYEKNGLYDVAYPFAVALEPQTASEAGVRWLDAADFFAADATWLELFEGCYEAFGGYQPRGPGFLERMVGTPTWQEAMRHEFSYCVAEEGGSPVGYAVLGCRDGRLTVMELAARDGSPDMVARLLAAARGRGVPVRCYASHASPMTAALRDLGVELPPRERGAMMLMVHVVDIESTGRKVWRDVEALRDVEVRVWTPEREGAIHAPASPVRTITLELKEHTLSRLLMRRLDVAAAVAEERITLCGGRPGDAQALGEALAPCPWAYHPIDYL